MCILYDSPVDFPIWSGDLNQAKTYWSKDPILAKGKYLMVTDYSRLDPMTFLLVRTTQALQNIWNSWTGKGIDAHEWRGRYLYVWITEASPIAGWLVAVIVAAAMAVVGFVAWKCLVEVRSTFSELGLSGKLFIGGIGIALIGGTVINLVK